jgi:5'-nucleotidase
MAYRLDDKLVIAISSRALFDLEEENAIYDNEGLEAYYDYQLSKRDIPLKPGSAFRFVKNLLTINQNFDIPLIEVIVLSRNNAATGLRIGHSLDHYGLGIQRSGWTAGTTVAKYLDPFKVDLFLSAYEEDVKEAITSGIAAATILPHTPVTLSNDKGVKIAFDGDAVLFGSESEEIFQEKGLEAFIAYERENAKTPLSKGPFFKFLHTISQIQNRFGMEKSPIRTALVTARDFSTYERVLRTLEVWGVHVDEAFFQGGVQKREVIKAFGADIFFDDQDAHLKHTVKETPSAKVPSTFVIKGDASDTKREKKKKRSRENISLQAFEKELKVDGRV